jgi:hypothetical protein
MSALRTAYLNYQRTKRQLHHFDQTTFTILSPEETGKIRGVYDGTLLGNSGRGLMSALLVRVHSFGTSQLLY